MHKLYLHGYRICRDRTLAMARKILAIVLLATVVLYITSKDQGMHMYAAAASIATLIIDL